MSVNLKRYWALTFIPCDVDKLLCAINGKMQFSANHAKVQTNFLSISIANASTGELSPAEILKDCWGFLSLAVTKTMTQSNLGRKRSLSSCIMKGSQGRNPRQEPGGKN